MDEYYFVVQHFEKEKFDIKYVDVYKSVNIVGGLGP